MGGRKPRKMNQLKDPSLFRQQAYIAGEWCDALQKERITVTNPATGEVIGSIPKMGAQETEAAITAANTAFSLWKRETAKHRAAILRRWYSLMLENSDDLARIMTLEQGQTFGRSQGRKRLRGQLYRMVRRRSQARLWRHH